MGKKLTPKITSQINVTSSVKVKRFKVNPLISISNICSIDVKGKATFSFHFC